jgi:hypothetical protein
MRDIRKGNCPLCDHHEVQIRHPNDQFCQFSSLDGHAPRLRTLPRPDLHQALARSGTEYTSDALETPRAFGISPYAV